MSRFLRQRVLRSVAVVVVGLVAGSWTAAAALDFRQAPGPNDEFEEPDYAVNTRGETYGSALSAPGPEYEPDLVSAIGADGTSGYLRRSEMYLQPPKSPEDAADWEARNSGKREIPLYARDGVTVVGVFVVENGNGTDEGITEQRRP